MAMTPLQKYERDATPRTKMLTTAFAGVPAGSRLHISTPRQIEERIRAIPAGTIIDVPTLRVDLAEASAADATCPTTTAIHLRVLVELMVEQLAESGEADVTPCWRVVDPDSPIARRVNGAPELIRHRRHLEGHRNPIVRERTADRTSAEPVRGHRRAR